MVIWKDVFWEGHSFLIAFCVQLRYSVHFPARILPSPIHITCLNLAQATTVPITLPITTNLCVMRWNIIFEATNKTCNWFCRISKQLARSASVSVQAVKQTIWSRTILCSRSIRNSIFQRSQRSALQHFFYLFSHINKRSEYEVFYKLMCWLGV